MKTVVLQLPEKLVLRIDEEARLRRVSRSKLIWQFIEAVLTKRKRIRRGSCYDLTRDLAGCLHGPRDLVTNPKYLEDFGRSPKK